VPPEVVTETDTDPAAWVGVVAVMTVGPVTWNDGGAAPPNSTAVAPVKWLPVIVTGVDPPAGPSVGATEVTVGCVTKENDVPAAAVPPAVTTETPTVPADCDLVVAVIFVPPVTTAKVLADVVPKSTAVAPVNPDPVMVTTVAPPTGPAVGATPPIVGLAT
jgi:hypothetical protein